MVAKGDRYGPDALAMSGEGKHVAFVGPSEFTVTVVDARSLDEVCMNIGQNTPTDHFHISWNLIEKLILMHLIEN